MIWDEPSLTYFKMPCAVYVIGHKKLHKMSAAGRQTLNLSMFPAYLLGSQQKSQKTSKKNKILVTSCTSASCGQDEHYNSKHFEKRP